MSRPICTVLAVAAFAATAVAQAPIERPSYRSAPGSAYTSPSTETHVLNPATGVQVLTNGRVETVAATNGRVELRVDSGKANVSVNRPADGTTILVDLPGGQADLTRDGFYTFNAETNTLSVLHGEAVAFPPNAGPDAEGKTVHEMQGAVLGQHIHPDDLYDAQAQTDILSAPGQQGYPQAQGAYVGRNDGGYGGGYGDAYAGAYGDGYYAPGYAYPAYAYGYPYYAGYYGYGYPWGWDYGWGYPYGFGIGFGFGYGGYYRGGFGYRGGYGYGGGFGGVHPGGYASAGGVAHGSAGGHR